MWRFSDVELNCGQDIGSQRSADRKRHLLAGRDTQGAGPVVTCVRTYTLLMPLLMQLLMGTSMRR